MEAAHHPDVRETVAVKVPDDRLAHLRHAGGLPGSEEGAVLRPNAVCPAPHERAVGAPDDQRDLLAPRLELSKEERADLTRLNSTTLLDESRLHEVGRPAIRQVGPGVRRRVKNRDDTVDLAAEVVQKADEHVARKLPRSVLVSRNTGGRTLLERASVDHPVLKTGLPRDRGVATELVVPVAYERVGRELVICGWIRLGPRHVGVDGLGRVRRVRRVRRVDDVRVSRRVAGDREEVRAGVRRDVGVVRRVDRVGVADVGIRRVNTDDVRRRRVVSADVVRRVDRVGRDRVQPGSPDRIREKAARHREGDEEDREGIPRDELHHERLQNPVNAGQFDALHTPDGSVRCMRYSGLLRLIDY